MRKKTEKKKLYSMERDARYFLKDSREHVLEINWSCQAAAKEEQSNNQATIKQIPNKHQANTKRVTGEHQACTKQLPSA